MMTHVIVTRSSQEKTVARRRQRLSAEQELALVTQVKERTELLKTKKKTLTLEEQRIRIDGERAFNSLVKEYKCLILSLVDRFNFLDQVTTDELYQVAVIAINQAISKHNPNRNGKLSRFSSWAFLIIRSKFIDMSKAELGLVNRTNGVRVELVRNNCHANERTPLKVSMEEDLKAQIDQVVEESLPVESVQVLRAFYYDGKRSKQIAAELGRSGPAIDRQNRMSRTELRANPRLQELAEAYIA
jgi:RNA polymerase sigma factor (sigma-70 family)